MKNTRKPGMLVVLPGIIQKFFREHEERQRRSWIIDQLTVYGDHPIEEWKAEKSPFAEDIVKIKLLRSW